MKPYILYINSNLTKYLISLPGALMLSGFAAAATVTWLAPATIAGGGDVNTDGTQVYGRSLIVATGSPVNGVKFGYAEPWSVTFSETGTYNQYGSGISTQTVGGPDADNYKAVLGNTRYFPANNTTITLGNLTIDQEYLFQIWVADYRAFPNDRTLSVTATGHTNVNPPTLKYLDSDLSNGPDAAHGQFVTATWTADATSMAFYLTGNQSTDYSLLQLRAIPEAGAALLGGLGTLVLLRRRRL